MPKSWQETSAFCFKPVKNCFEEECLDLAVDLCSKLFKPHTDNKKKLAIKCLTEKSIKSLC